MIYKIKFKGRTFYSLDQGKCNKYIIIFIHFIDKFVFVNCYTYDRCTIIVLNRRPTSSLIYKQGYTIVE